MDAIYGHEYEFKEIKAPTSYQLADKSKAYKVEADEETIQLFIILKMLVLLFQIQV